MLFLIASTKNACIAKMWEQIGEGGCWNPRFTRQIHDWELDEVEAFSSNCRRSQFVVV